MEYVITSFTKQDYAEFSSLFEEYFVQGLQLEVDNNLLAEICAEIQAQVEAGVLFLDFLRQNNLIVGFILYQVDSPLSDWCEKEGCGCIREMYIKPENRHNGMGRALAQYAENKLRGLHVSRIYLTSDTNAAFWVQCGYTNMQEVCERNKLPIYTKDCQ